MSDAKKGERRIVTKAWRTAALESMAATGATRAEVAEKAGTSGPYLTMLVKGKYKTSDKLDALSEALGIAVPETRASTPTVQGILEGANKLSEDHAQG